MRKLLMATVALVGVALAASSAQAALIATVSGNDCAGVFGTPPNCVASGTYNNVTLNNTPLIVKLNPNGTVSELGVFPTITGSEFSLSAGATGFVTYTYTPGVGDPLLQYVVVKGSDAFNIFSVAPSGTDTVFAPINNGGQQSGVSHISFYDTFFPPTPVPAPAGLMLLGAGLLGLGAVRWARKSA